MGGVSGSKGKYFVNLYPSTSLSFYEGAFFDLLKGAEKDPKESLNHFSGARFNPRVARGELSDYVSKLPGIDMEYAVSDLVSAYRFLSAPDVRVMCFHPSCLGDGGGPVSVYTKKKDRKVALLVRDVSLF